MSDRFADWLRTNPDRWDVRIIDNYPVIERQVYLNEWGKTITVRQLTPDEVREFENAPRIESGEDDG